MTANWLGRPTGMASASADSMRIASCRMATLTGAPAARSARGAATTESPPRSSRTTVPAAPVSATVPARKFARPRNRATNAVAGRR